MSQTTIAVAIISKKNANRIYVSAYVCRRGKQESKGRGGDGTSSECRIIDSSKQ